MSKIQVTVNNPQTNEKVAQTVELDALVGDLEMTVNGAQVLIRKLVETGQTAVAVNGAPAEPSQPLKEGDEVTTAPRKVGMATA